MSVVSLLPHPVQTLTHVCCFIITTPSTNTHTVTVSFYSHHTQYTHCNPCLLFHCYHTQYKHTPVTYVSVVLQSPHPVQKCTPVYSHYTQYKPSHLFTVTTPVHLCLFTVTTPCTLTPVFSKHTQYTHTCAITTPSTHSHLFTVITPSTNTHTYSLH